MKIYLYMSFSISPFFYSGSNSHPFQGVVQGNYAAPALWLIIIIFLTHYLYHKQVVTQLFLPISKISVALVTLLYINNSSLYIFSDGNESATIMIVKV